ncbi:MAG: thioesterase family protein [Luminiphilus sp.]|jgi:acyl-CoA thioester hydrolase|nr:thioesterase family protein [Luminiphilus sp.]
MSDRPRPALRSDYSCEYQLESRWADNDVYGHINNVAYYAYFDSVVNRFLIEEGGLRPGVDTVVGYVVHSSANYFSPATYPVTLSLGLKVLRMGDKSVTWEVGVFIPESDHSCVTGTFTHAFVDRSTGESAPVPVSIRAAIEQLPLPG